MSTARADFFQGLLGIVASAKGKERYCSEIEKLLDNFRVQTKPGKELNENQTAREALLDELTTLLADSNPRPDQLKNIVAMYRMQFKKPGEGRSATDIIQKKVKGPVPRGSASRMQLPSLVDLRKKSENPNQVEKIAGGPKKKSSSRGICPKCHSSGVVLAKSFSGDDYFSCIYCGFQAYRRHVDADIDLPLAAELLGRRFDENDRE